MGGVVDAGKGIVFSDPFNVANEFIDRHLLVGRADKVAVRTRNGGTTYRELFEGVNRTANYLCANKVSRGARLLMIIKDSVEFFFAFWGAIKAGIVPVPVNTLLRARDFAFMLENSECEALLYSPEYASEVEAALEISSHQPNFVLKIEDDDATFARRIASFPAEFAAVETSPTDECFWLYSSGSTGNPKGAVHLHRDMVVSSEYYAVRTLGAREDDVFFSAAKLFFAYGLGNGMTFPLWVGGAAVLLDEKPTPSKTFAFIETFRPTIFFGVPTLYAAQLRALETATPDLSSLRLCVSAGEGLPADILSRWRERTGTLILDGLGSTEALHIFISNRAENYKPGSSGLVVEGYDAKIVDDAGQTLPAGETGRLFIKGRSIAKYYWKNPEKTAQTMVGDWIDTGDMYYQDKDGFFFYCGRSDDMLKVGGIWCSPFEIEATLIEHPAILEIAVVGRADAEGLINPEAWVVLVDEASPTDALEAELRAFCKAKLAPYKFPRRFHFVDGLPKTATGKIQRYRLRSEE
jgi:benzoate-CoA ligase family protein